MLARHSRRTVEMLHAGSAAGIRMTCCTSLTVSSRRYQYRTCNHKHDRNNRQHHQPIAGAIATLSQTAENPITPKVDPIQKGKGAPAKGDENFKNLCKNIRDAFPGKAIEASSGGGIGAMER